MDGVNMYCFTLVTLSCECRSVKLLMASEHVTPGHGLNYKFLSKLYTLDGINATAIAGVLMVRARA